MSSIMRRLSQTGVGPQDPASLPWNPNSTKFPTRKELPKLPNAPEGAAWVWGKDDYIGRLNLLTPSRVKAAASDIKTGELVRLDLPAHIPEQPAFGREKFIHTIKTIAKGVAYDDRYDMNTQSGTQWDGFRHFAHLPSATFYNGTTDADIIGPSANLNCSIHHWSAHGIAGRGILLDYRSYANTNGITYDPYRGHAISFEDLQKCGRAQGINILPQSQGGDIKVGDILLIRSGFIERYNELPASERTRAALRTENSKPEILEWAGVKQEDAMIDWLHDCYFAAVAGDAPSFERWPSEREYYLHEYILALWGMPLGEMWDLEKLAQMCKDRQRWTFFVTSAPANVHGGVSSHSNATAIF